MVPPACCSSRAIGSAKQRFLRSDRPRRRAWRRSARRPCRRLRPRSARRRDWIFPRRPGTAHRRRAPRTPRAAQRAARLERPGGAITGRAMVFCVKNNSITLRSASDLTKSSADGKSGRSGSRCSAPCISRVTFLSRSQSGRCFLRLAHDQSPMPWTSPRSMASAISAVPLYPVTILNLVPMSEL